MYIVGLISKYECCKMSSYDTFEKAKEELSKWRKIFLLNNNVSESVTVTNRDYDDSVLSIKHCFRLPSKSEEYIMFLSKCR